MEANLKIKYIFIIYYDYITDRSWFTMSTYTIKDTIITILNHNLGSHLIVTQQQCDSKAIGEQHLWCNISTFAFH